MYTQALRLLDKGNECRQGWERVNEKVSKKVSKEMSEEVSEVNEKVR